MTKQLTTMDYEKKYKEALEKAKKIVNDQNASSVWKGWLCNCFPELKESEDERIRKWIIGVLSTYEHDKNLIDDAIAWLEKQGKQKHTDKTESKFKAGDIIRRKVPFFYDKDMQVARIEKDYYICNHIGKFSSEVVPFSEESCYELVEQLKENNYGNNYR